MPVGLHYAYTMSVLHTFTMPVLCLYTTRMSIYASTLSILCLALTCTMSVGPLFLALYYACTILHYI